MALFNKKLSLDEILKGLKELSPEDQAQVKEKMEDLYKAEDEREIDKIEEEKADDNEIKDEKSEEVADESEEIANDVDEVETEVMDGEETVAETEEKAGETEPTEEVEQIEKESLEQKAQDDELDTAQTARITVIEETLAKMQEVLDGIVDRLDKRDFGYNPSAPAQAQESTARRDAVLRGYAGDKAKNYF